MKVDLQVEPLLRFFDDPNDDDRGHASALVSMIGEELGASLACRQLAEKHGARTQVLRRDGKFISPKRSGKSGPRLDCWILVDASAERSALLYQVEIKNWSAHALNGKKLPNLASEEEVARHGEERWGQVLEKGEFRWPEVLGKALVDMQAPTGKFDGVTNHAEFQRVLANAKPMKLLCLWWPVRSDKGEEVHFSAKVRRAEDGQEIEIDVFSMSAYLRRFRKEGGLKEIALEMPLAHARRQLMTEIGL